MNTELMIGIGLILAAAFVALRPKGGARIDGTTARQLVGDGATLVDVRSASEYSHGKIAGSKNIPLNELGKRIDEIPKANPVVVHCQSGGRSASAARILSGQGYEVHDLGPMSAW